MERRISPRGFTLPELLTVVAIIALLIALLLPSLSKVRESANSIVCQSNLRQIVFAMMNYANDNHGLFPASAVFSAPAQADWVYWQKGRNVRDSAIAPYLAGPLPAILRCPSDDPSARSRVLTDPYPYSYTFNFSFSQNFFGRVCKLGTIVHSSDKMMIVCEDEWSADDGNWDGRLVSQTNENVLANRHSRPRNTTWEYAQALPAGARPDAGEIGNVGFADGHAGPMPRSTTWLDTSYLAMK